MSTYRQILLWSLFITGLGAAAVSQAGSQQTQAASENEQTTRVYQARGKNGEVVFSDQPSATSQTVDIVTTSPDPAAAAAARQNTQDIQDLADELEEARLARSAQRAEANSDNYLPAFEANAPFQEDYSHYPYARRWYPPLFPPYREPIAPQPQTTPTPEGPRPRFAPAFVPRSPAFTPPQLPADSGSGSP